MTAATYDSSLRLRDASQVQEVLREREPASPRREMFCLLVLASVYATPLTLRRSPDTRLGGHEATGTHDPLQPCVVRAAHVGTRGLSPAGYDLPSKPRDWRRRPDENMPLCLFVDTSKGVGVT